MDKSRLYLYCDRAIEACLCLCIFLLPFLKAGVELFTWLAFFFWLLKRTLGYRADALWGMLPESRLNKALGVCLAFNALSVVFSTSFALSLRGFFGKELKFLAIYFMLIEIIDRRSRLRNILITITASAALVVADAAVQLFKGVDYIGHYLLWGHRLSSSFSSPNSLAAWLVMLIPIFLSILLSPKKYRFFRTIKPLSALFVLLLSACLFLTYSRGAWLGLCVGLGIFFIYFAKALPARKKIYLLFIVVIISLGYIFLPQLIKNNICSINHCPFLLGQPVESRFKSRESLNIRTQLWKEALLVIKHYPIIGSGLNTYSIVAPRFKIFEGGGIYPHNSFLQKTAETGFLGLGSFLWLLFLFLKNSFGYFDRKKDFMILGFFSGILAFLVHAFFDNHLYALQLVVLFWFMVGLTVSVMKLHENAE